MSGNDWDAVPVDNEPNITRAADKPDLGWRVTVFRGAQGSSFIYIVIFRVRTWGVSEHDAGFHLHRLSIN